MLCRLSSIDPDNEGNPLIIQRFLRIIHFPMTCADECFFSLINLLPHKGKPDFNRAVWKQITREKAKPLYYLNEIYNYLVGCILYGQLIKWCMAWFDKLTA